MAEALRLVFGESAEQRVKRHRRAKLKPEVRTQCDRFDAEIAAAESEEAMATTAELSAVQADLLRLRKRHAALQC